MAWRLGSLQRRLSDAMKGGGGDNGLANRVSALEGSSGDFRKWLSSPLEPIDNQNESISIGVSVAGISVAAGGSTQSAMRSHARAINSILVTLREKGLVSNA